MENYNITYEVILSPNKQPDLNIIVFRTHNLQKIQRTNEHGRDYHVNAISKIQTEIMSAYYNEWILFGPQSKNSTVKKNVYRIHGAIRN